MSTWKQRRLSQRQSVNDDTTTPPAAPAGDSLVSNNTALLAENALRGPISDAGIEESVLAMFGFSRADYAAPVSKKSSEENLTVTPKVPNVSVVTSGSPVAPVLVKVIIQ